MNSRYKIIAGVMVFGLSSLLQAADGLPPEKTYGNVNYVSGGVGLDESTAFKAAAKDYSLALLFAQGQGEYLANVSVTIKDKAGNTVLDTVSDGPMLLATLPPGNYRISAEIGGSVQTRSVHVGGKGSVKQSFVWSDGEYASARRR